MYPGDCGSSAIDDKYPSSFLLNVGKSTLVRLRIDFGSALKRFPPWMAKLASTSPCTLVEADFNGRPTISDGRSRLDFIRSNVGH